MSEQAQINETELFMGLEEMSHRLKKLVVNGIICKQYAQELWTLHVRALRRAYIFAEDRGIEVMDQLAYHVQECHSGLKELGDALKEDYMKSLGSGIPLLPDENLWLEGEEPQD